MTLFFNAGRLMDSFGLCALAFGSSGPVTSTCAFGKMRCNSGMNGMGWAMDPNAEATKDAMDAMEEAFGVAPVNKGEGGSIPFIPELQRIFPKAQVLVTGPEDPKANAHSPNESISLPALKNNVITEALLLDKLAK